MLEEKGQAPFHDTYMQKTLLGIVMKCGPLHLYVVFESQRETKYNI